MNEQVSWRLTPREEQLMECLIAHGYRKRISTQMNLSIKTVDAYIERIKQKVGVQTSVQLAVAYDRSRRVAGN